MRHARAQIREYVAGLLTGCDPIVKVYRSRTADVAVANLPAALVFLDDESSETITQGSNPTQERTAILNVVILARTKDESDPEYEFDAVADECALVVENALADSDKLGGLVKILSYVGMTSEYESEQPDARVTLEYALRYTVQAKNPETIT